MRHFIVDAGAIPTSTGGSHVVVDECGRLWFSFGSAGALIYDENEVFLDTYTPSTNDRLFWCVVLGQLCHVRVQLRFERNHSYRSKRYLLTFLQKKGRRRVRIHWDYSPMRCTTSAYPMDSQTFSGRWHCSLINKICINFATLFQSSTWLIVIEENVFYFPQNFVQILSHFKPQKLSPTCTEANCNETLLNKHWKVLQI